MSLIILTGTPVRGKNGAVDNFLGKTGVLNMSCPRQIRICGHLVSICLPNKTVCSCGRSYFVLDLCISWHEKQCHLITVVQ